MRLLAVAFSRTAVPAGAPRPCYHGMRTVGGRERATRCSPAPGSRSADSAGSPVPHSRESLPQINQREEDQSDDQLNPAVFSHHLIADRIWISGQANFIFQAHNPFHSPYAGTNSFQSRVETTALSRVLTLYTGVKLARWSEFIFDAEEAGGKGLSQALGMAGFVNLDVVRNPSLGQGVYAARYFIHETFPLTADPIRESNPTLFIYRSQFPGGGSNSSWARWAWSISSTTTRWAVTAICSSPIGPSITTALTITLPIPAAIPLRRCSAIPDRNWMPALGKP